VNGLAADDLCRRLRWDDLDPDYLTALAQTARAEDLDGAGLRRPPARGGDATSALLADHGFGRATVVARAPMVLCGMEMIPYILHAYGIDTDAELHCADGAVLETGAVIAETSGPSVKLLQAERPLLNFLQRLSGIATETRRYVDALGDSQTRLLDTRKTTPGWRMLEKYAVACGGGWNHRLGLFDRIMLKDNHLAAGAAGTGEALANVVRSARDARPDLAVEVEVDRLDQIPPVLEAGAHIVLLDNFSEEALAEAVRLIGGRASTEASGGITLEKVPRLGTLGLDFISTGALVHRSSWCDIGLDWRV